jgi:hypothetical protein
MNNIREDIAQKKTIVITKLVTGTDDPFSGGSSKALFPHPVTDKSPLNVNLGRYEDREVLVGYSACQES